MMLFDFDYGSKDKHNFYISKKNLLFIENLCCCSLKIAVCAPKITIASKNYYLKITIISKNCRLKIIVRARMYAHMYARAYDCQDSTGHTTSTPPEHGTPPEHTTTEGEQESSKGRAKTKKFFVLYIGIEKYLQKMLKKICRYRNLLYLCSRNQITNKFNYKITKQ